MPANKTPFQLEEKYKVYRNLLEEHYKYLVELRQQFIAQYGQNQTQFPKFRWQKSFRDHYIRSENDFDEHLRYIYENPMKHKIDNPEKYKYVYTNYPDLIDAA